MPELKNVLNGAMAGAAGTTVLNAVGYGDMALRGRPASRTPDQVVEELARRIGLTMPSGGEAHQSRLEGLGALAGIATGVAVGTAAGRLRGAVRRLGPLAGPATIGGAAMLATDLTTAALGVSDPRTWDATSWLSDIVPHLAFGAVVYAALAEPLPSEASAAAAPPVEPVTRASVVLGRAAALGAATGLRSTVALAALVVRGNDGLPAVLRHPAARLAATMADGGELIGDKLPITPSRLTPPGLASRVISASLAAAVVARSGHRHPVPAVAIASAAAVAAAKIGHDTRRALARHFPDPAVAVVEDAVAIGLAALGS
jgi:uncharacterized membrane protein